MKGKVLFCLTLLLVSFCSFAYSQEEEEPMSLFEIDKLIRKTEYEEALKQLNFYIEKNPDQFDNAQTRIAKIMNARIRYSELATKLIDIIRNDPTNNKKIYEITSQLEMFEKHPSDKNLQFIADVKKSAEFNYFRSTFIEVQNAVADCVKAEDVIGAIEAAQGGFWVYKDSFYEQWEERPDIIQKVDSTVNDLNVHLEAFKTKNFLSDIKEVIGEFVKAVNNDQYDLALEKFGPVKVQLDKYYNAVKLVASDKEKLEQIVNELEVDDPTITEASYLSFLIHYMTGVDNIEYSGVLTGLSVVWNNFVSKMNNPVFAKVVEKYKLHEDGVNDVFVASLGKYTALEEIVLNEGAIPYNDKSFITANPFDDYLMLTKYVSKLSRSVLNGTNLLDVVKANKIAQDNVIIEFYKANGFSSKQKELQKLIEYSSELDRNLVEKKTFDIDYAQWSGEYINSSYDNWDDLTEKYVAIVDEIYSIRDSIMEKSWHEITQFYMNEGENVYQRLLGYTDTADDYSKGIFTKIPENILSEITKDITKSVTYKDVLNGNKELDLGVYYHYPDISVEILNYVNSQADLGINTISEYLNYLDKDFKYFDKWVNDDIISGKVIEAQVFLKKQIENIQNLKAECKPLYDNAKNMIIAAEVAKNEGDLRFAEAEAALEKQNFEKARKNLQSALVKYDESLNNQNNETLRAEWDSKLQKLGEEIARVENQLVVVDVRNLKNKAKDAYFNGRFDDADMYLNQASAKWALTNVTEDPEIVNLRNFVNTAISMKTGREILPSAPQYPEMSQLMNIAHQNFDEGQSLLKAGNKKGAEDKFNQALESIQKVQYVYPLNQDAALLTLQINKLSDPDKFESEFENKIKSAVALCKNRETQQEGYANLLDYYKLDPNYPGLKDLIYDIEIEIGIRQKPVDNSGKIQGQKYVKEAESIFNRAGNDLTQLNNALNKVNQALSLLPDDSSAMILKDKITTKMGGNASTVLSTEDERLYQLAIQRLQNNNVVGARAIVDELLKKPQNKYSKKIKDLKNKIESRS